MVREKPANDANRKMDSKQIRTGNKTYPVGLRRSGRLSSINGSVPNKADDTEALKDANKIESNLIEGDNVSDVDKPEESKLHSDDSSEDDDANRDSVEADDHKVNEESLTGEYLPQDSDDSNIDDSEIDESDAERSDNDQWKQRRNSTSSIESDDTDEEEAQLEQAVFGSGEGHAGILKNKLERISRRKRPRQLKAKNFQSTTDCSFFVDTKGNDTDTDSSKESNEEYPDETSSAAWIDDDDQNLVVDLSTVARLRKLRKSESETRVDAYDYAARLREQREKMTDFTPAWAQVRKKYDESLDDDEALDDGGDEETRLLRNSLAYTKSPKSSRVLPSGKLFLSRLNDANQQCPSRAVVQCVDWHKNGPILLTAGLDKKLCLFSIDGKRNQKLESIYFKDMPIYSAAFCGKGHEQVVCAGRRKYFYWVDLKSGSVGKVPGLLGREEKSLESMVLAPDGGSMIFCGRDGNLLTVSQQTKQFIYSLKMNENACCAAYSHDGMSLYSSGGKGMVYCWDIRTRRIRFRFRDEGSIATRSIAVSKDEKRIAVGSTNGVVNVYDPEKVSESFSLGNLSPRPLKVVMNLTTAVDELSFNHDGQLLAMLSRRKKDSLKLLNVNTNSLVSNWPTSGTPIHYGSCVRFSSNSEMLAVGNDRGRCLLYSLHHYSQRK